MDFDSGGRTHFNYPLEKISLGKRIFLHFCLIIITMITGICSYYVLHLIFGFLIFGSSSMFFGFILISMPIAIVLFMAHEEIFRNIEDDFFNKIIYPVIFCILGALVFSYVVLFIVVLWEAGFQWC